MARELVGYVAVDSGQVVIIDPCHLGRWEDNSPDWSMGVHNPATGEMLLYGKDFKSYDVPIKARNGKTANFLLENGWEQIKPDPDDTLSYRGACVTTLLNQTGQLRFQNGVEAAIVSTAGYGDGPYPVYASFNKEGRVKKLEIEFTEGEE